jgi:hypothetical protein
MEAINMIDNQRLSSAIKREVAARGGIVVMNGRQMIKTDIARSVIRDFLAGFFDEARKKLPATISADALAERKLFVELDESARRLEKVITELLPIMH